MASSSPFVFILLVLSPFLFSLTSQVYAQGAPAPAPKGPANLTGILDKAGQFTTLIRLLTSTQISNQIKNQLNSSDQGLTVLAPTDNAFNNLKAGTLNDLNTQEQVELILYHVLPKFYSVADLLSVSNPVRTQATGQDGGQFGLNFTSSANQVNVSSGIVTTQLNNALSKDFPLAVYQVDKVLLPLDIFGPKPPKSSPSPSSPGDDKPKKAPAATSGPSASKDTDASGSIAMNVGLSGMLVLIGSMCIGLF
ncbi:Fasciclin-like arabinogalactan protein [Thalictrum thalictroides]|uniref:Fasciclin-like arabinogalactan protein n=1 Tax=Thalictrum thalictroides TaxID=46969 RepID=A0A7J6VHH1_THATH|nr:Fasciclin-like arabinogalactan protein [Thalictrum thalictroides]